MTGDLYEETTAGGMQAAYDRLEPILPGLKRFLYTLCGGDYEDIQDCLQETAIRVIRSENSFRGQSTFRSWVYSIARNLAVDSYRRKHRRRKYEREVDFSGIPEISAGPEFDPELQLLRRQEQEQVMDALMSLPEKHRSCLYLREIDGLSLEEIGSLLGLPEGTVKSRLFHARRAFIRAYGRLAEVKPGGGYERKG